MKSTVLSGSLRLILLMSCLTFSVTAQKIDRDVTVKESEVRQWATELKSCDLLQAEHRMLVLENDKLRKQVTSQQTEIQKKANGIKYLVVALFISILYFIVSHFIRNR